SGTVQSATLAKNMVEYDRIHIIDTLSASMGLRLLVEYAVAMRADGKPIDDIVNILDGARHRLVLLAMVDTLEYLQKGGRLSKGAATMGTLLRIKPIVTLNKGSLEMLAKARGLKNGNKILSEQMEKAGGLDPNVPVYLGYTRDKEQVMNFKAQAIRDHGLDKVEMHPVGCVIGTHTGPGAVILVYLKSKQDEA
ncbi:MAG: DegV family protein, partial [Eubacterium sp.]